MDKKTSNSWFWFGQLIYWSLFMYGLGAQDLYLISIGLGLMVFMFFNDWMHAKKAKKRPTDLPGDKD
jgi:hypothetical protein